MIARSGLSAWGIAIALGWPSIALAGLSLDEAITRHRALLDTGSISRGLSPVSLGVDADDFTTAIGGTDGDVPPLLRPELRGEGGFRLRTHASFADDRVRVRLGAAWRAADEHPVSYDESEISTRLGAGRIYASVERRHWGPSWVGSLILDGASRPVPGVGWRKSDARPFTTPWLSWLGPWTLDVFGGGLWQRSGPAHPRLIGARLQFMPLEGLELGASRTLQWGGRGRPQSLGSLYRALVGHDNVDSGSPDGNEPGNQLAGFDARYTLRLGERRSVSLYGQAIGEDEAGHLPSHYLASIGVDAAVPFGTATTVRVFAEYANTSENGAVGRPRLNQAYRHHIYTDGYTQQGDPLAYPAGGDVRLGSIGVLVDGAPWAGTLRLHRGDAYSTAQLYPGGGRLAGADAEIAWQTATASRVGLQLSHWHAPQQSRTRAQLWWRYAFR